mmetsp:Transcript_105420/g.304953  ORF Transcript_105420/g.304953 Transcript_105420/m.304953 type:complete len:252 (+) Transcript_105420:763-1518(+)
MHCDCGSALCARRSAVLKSTFPFFGSGSVTADAIAAEWWALLWPWCGLPTASGSETAWDCDDMHDTCCFKWWPRWCSRWRWWPRTSTELGLLIWLTETCEAIVLPASWSSPSDSLSHEHKFLPSHASFNLRPTNAAAAPNTNTKVGKKRSGSHTTKTNTNHTIVIRRRNTKTNNSMGRFNWFACCDNTDALATRSWRSVGGKPWPKLGCGRQAANISFICSSTLMSNTKWMRPALLSLGVLLLSRPRIVSR